MLNQTLNEGGINWNNHVIWKSGRGSGPGFAQCLGQGSLQHARTFAALCSVHCFHAARRQEGLWAASQEPKKDSYLFLLFVLPKSCTATHFIEAHKVQLAEHTYLPQCCCHIPWQVHSALATSRDRGGTEAPAAQLMARLKVLTQELQCFDSHTNNSPLLLHKNNQFHCCWSAFPLAVGLRVRQSRRSWSEQSI